MDGFNDGRSNKFLSSIILVYQFSRLYKKRNNKNFCEAYEVITTSKRCSLIDKFLYQHLQLFIFTTKYSYVKTFYSTFTIHRYYLKVFKTFINLTKWNLQESCDKGHGLAHNFWFQIFHTSASLCYPIEASLFFSLVLSYMILQWIFQLRKRSDGPIKSRYVQFVYGLRMSCGKNTNCTAMKRALKRENRQVWRTRRL